MSEFMKQHTVSDKFTFLPEYIDNSQKYSIKVVLEIIWEKLNFEMSQSFL